MNSVTSTNFSQRNNLKRHIVCNHEKRDHLNVNCVTSNVGTWKIISLLFMKKSSLINDNFVKIAFQKQFLLETVLYQMVILKNITNIIFEVNCHERIIYWTFSGFS